MNWVTGDGLARWLLGNNEPRLSKDCPCEEAGNKHRNHEKGAANITTGMTEVLRQGCKPELTQPASSYQSTGLR